MRLLLTRPRQDGERTALALARQGHLVEIAPLMRVDPVADAAIGTGPWWALVFTSANAVNTAGGLAGFAALKGFPVFAVGERTAAAARAAGFRQVVVAGGDAQQLLQAIRAGAKATRGRDPLLYLAGEDVSHDLAGLLAADDIVVRTVTVYRAVKVARLPAHLEAALAASEIDGVLHFSRRSAEAFLDCARAAAVLAQALRAAHYCISQQAAAPLTAAGAPHVHVAPRPDEASLIALVGE